MSLGPKDGGLEQPFGPLAMEQRVVVERRSKLLAGIGGERRDQLRVR